jgi:pimeloyl-ACP methyl ester carboxylesterase
MFFGHLPDHLILFPTRSPIDAGAAARRTIPFENGELEIWTAQSQSARQQGRADVFILRFYGNADRADRWPAMEAGMWKDRAVEIWGMNYPGFGGSTGPARLARIGPAAVAAFDELKRHAANKSAAVQSAIPSGPTPSSPLTTAQATAPIVVFGTSIGVTAALYVAVSHPTEIAGLILQNPPPLREMILRQFGWWNLWLTALQTRAQVAHRQSFYWRRKTRSWHRVFISWWFRHTPEKNASSNCAARITTILSKEPPWRI